MAQLLFQGPAGDVVENPNLDTLRPLILAPFSDYWAQGNGGASFEYRDGPINRSLLFLPNSEYGVYLKYLDESETEWLSLHDPQRLDQVTECSDEWYASIGLFIPPEPAWEAVKEFCQSGGRTEKITWIDPGDIPEGGNW